MMASSATVESHVMRHTKKAFSASEYVTPFGRYGSSGLTLRHDWPPSDEAITLLELKVMSVPSLSSLGRTVGPTPAAKTSSHSTPSSVLFTSPPPDSIAQ